MTSKYKFIDNGSDDEFDDNEFDDDDEIDLPGRGIEHVSSESGFTAATVSTLIDISCGPQDDPVQPHAYNFPGTHFGNKVRSFNPTWFDKYRWFEYSISKDAVFCYACRFFSMGSRVEESFVNVGFRDWKHATGTTGGFIKHDTSVRHKNATASWKDFKANQRNHTSIASSLDNSRRKLVLHNRHYLKTIIEVLVFCASQEIGFRGHRDVNSMNRGNFLELLELVAKHDPVVRAHMKDGPRNAIYTSHNIQNELLHLLGNRLRKTICQGVKDAGYFSILADETRDFGKEEQMSFAVRYVNMSDGSIHEHFLTYIHAKGLNAESLTGYIKDLLNQFDLILLSVKGMMVPVSSVVVAVEYRRESESLLLMQYIPIATHTSSILFLSTQSNQYPVHLNSLL